MKFLLTLLPLTVLAGSVKKEFCPCTGEYLAAGEICPKKEERIARRERKYLEYCPCTGEYLPAGEVCPAKQRKRDKNDRDRSGSSRCREGSPRPAIRKQRTNELTDEQKRRIADQESDYYPFNRRHQEK